MLIRPMKSRLLSISNDTITLTDGGFVVLPASTSLDNDTTNEIQTLSISNDTIFLTNGGFAILPPTSINNDNDSTNELITSAVITNDTLTITEAGIDFEIDLKPYVNALDNDADSTNEIQVLSISNDTISLTDGGFVVLPASTSLDNDTTNEIQTLSISNDTIFLTNGGFAILPPTSINNDNDSTNELITSAVITNDTLTITEAGIDFEIDLKPYVNALDNDADSTNEIQVLSISNDTITLTDGGFVVLPASTSLDNDTTNEIQTLSISNDTIFLTNGGFAILPPTSINNDNDSTNELITSAVITNDTLTITEAGIDFEIDLKPYVNALDNDADSTNEIQVLSLSNDTVFLSDGGFVKLPGDNDSDSTNEIQTLSISNDTVFLTNGGFAVLPAGNVNNDNDSTNELITSAVITNDTLTITEAGIDFEIDLKPYVNALDNDADSTNEIQVLSLSNDTVFLSDGGFVKLPGDNDSDSTNEIQTLSISNDTVFLTNGGFAVLPAGNVNNDNDSTNELITSAVITNDTLTITEAGIDFEIDLKPYVNALDNDADSTNEIQVLSLSNDTVFLSDGGFVKLPGDNDSDSTNEIQTLSISNDTVFLTNGGFAVLPAGNVNNDNDSTNELITSAVITNDTLTITEAGIDFDIDLKPYVNALDNDTSASNEIQVLSLSNDTVFLTNGGFVKLPTDNDTSSSNEIQTLSISNDTVFLTNGGFAVLPAGVANNDNDSTNELITSAIITNDTLTITEAGIDFDIDLKPYVNAIDNDTSASNEIQVLSLSNDTVFLTNGGFVKLPTDNDTSASNEIQTLSISNDTVFLTNGGFAVLPAGVANNDNDSTNELITSAVITNDTLTITEAGIDFEIDLKPYVNALDNDADSTNEIQVLSLSNDTVFLSDGGFVKLPGDNDSDSTNEIQTLSISNDTVFLTNGGFAVLPAGVTNNDNDSTNELITSAVITNDTLTITEAGIDFDIDLKPYVNAIDNDTSASNEIQVLSLSNDTVFLTNGGFVKLPTDNDADSTNEIQTLSISNDTVFLTNGGFAVLPAGVANNDNDSTNELITSAVITNDTLTITEAGIDFDIDLKPYVNAIDNDTSASNEIQVLSLSNDTVFLTNGGFVKLPTDNDTSASNEIQTLSISNDTVFLTNGGFAVLPPTAVNNDNDSTNELITSAVITNDTLTITEAGIDFDIDLKPYVNALDNDTSASNEIQVLSLSNDTVFLTNGGFVKLPTDNDTSASNEIQTLSISNDTVFLTNGGFAVLPPTAVNNDNDSTNELITSAVITNDTLTITEAGIDFDIDLKPYVNALDNDTSASNEIQVLSLSNDTVFLTNGGFVKLPTDNDTSASNEIQTLSISNDTVFLTNGGFAVLPAGATNNDNDSTNELITSATISNDTLTITEAGIDFDIDLKPYVNALDNDTSASNEIQVLSLSNDTVFLTNGGFVKLPTDNDTSASNEIQTLSISNDTVFLTNGGFAVLPPNAINNDNDSTNELITSATITNDTLTITEAGIDFDIDLKPYVNALDNDTSASNEIQVLSLSNDTVFLTNGGFVKLPTDNDTSASNEIQTLSISNDTVFLTNGGFAVLPPTAVNNDNDSTNELITSATITNDTLTITEAGIDFDIDLKPYVNALDNDTSASNEIQVLSLSNDTVFLTNGGFVKLPTDNDTSASNEIQTLSISNDTVFLTNGGFAVLPAGATNNDNDSTNELITSATITNDTLTITEAGIDFDIDLKPYVNALDNDTSASNEIQVLSLSNDTVFLTNGGFVKLPTDNDTSASNEIQTLSISNDTVFLTNGGFAVLPPTAVNNDNDSTNELITSATITNDTLTITEAGIDFDIDLKPYVNALDNDTSASNEIQVLSLSNDTVFLTNGGFVKLPTDNDTSASNEIQTLSISNDTVFLTNGGFAVLPPTAVNNDNDSTNELITSATITNDTLTITEAGIDFDIDLKPYVNALDNDTSASNEIQVLSLSNDTVFLTNGGFVKLPTDNDTSASNEIQTLSISNDTVFLTNGGFAVLPPTAVNNDNDSTNELITSAVITNDTLTITEAGIDFDIDLKPYVNALDNDTSASNEIQVLSLSNDTVFLTNGGFVKLPTDNDTSASNEIQTLSISNDTVFLSNGGFAVLPAAATNNDNDSTNELITSATITNDTLTITEAGIDFDIDLKPYVNALDNDTSASNEIQVLSLSNDTVFLTNGGFVKLPTDNDTSASNEIQTLSISNDTVFLTNGGFAVLPPTAVNNDNDSTNELITSATITNDTLTITEAGIDFDIDLKPYVNALDNDTSASNEIQVLSLSNDTVFLTNGGFVKLPTDNDTSASNEIQTLSISNDTVFLSNGGFAVLPAAATNNDNDSTNELITSATITNDTLTITEGGIDFDIDLKPYVNALDNDTSASNEIQVLSLSNDTVFLTNGGFVKLPTDNDTSASNEIQTLSISNDTVFLTNGGFAVLPPTAVNNDNDSTNELQTLSITGGGGTISLSDGGGSVTLQDSSSTNELITNIGTNATTGIVTITEGGANTNFSVAFAINNDTNELVDSLRLSGPVVQVFQAGSAIPLTLDLSSLLALNPDTLTFSPLGDTAALLSHNNGVGDTVFFNTNDIDPTNELITSFELQNDSLLIIQDAGGPDTVNLAGLVNNDTNELVDSLNLSGNTLQLFQAGSSTPQTVSLNSLSADDSTRIRLGDSKAYISPADSLFRIDINGTEKFRFSEKAMEPLNLNNNIYIGENAGANDSLAGLSIESNIGIGKDALTNTHGSGGNVGGSNIAIGNEALKANTTGETNVALGRLALTLNTTGSSNTAIGTDALSKTISSVDQTALGTSALRDNNNSANTAIGRSALVENTNGFNNVALGAYAGATNQGQENIFIGYSAGANESGSSKLYIENSNSASPLIYGEFNNDLLQINGTFSTGMAGGDTLTYPTTDGSPGDILVTDGSGNLSFSSAASTVFTDSTSGIIRSTGGNYSRDFVFGSPTLDDSGNSSHDHKFFFDKSSGAFRAGSATGSAWNAASLGTYSTAFGEDVTVSGDYSFGSGRDNDVAAEYSNIFGRDNQIASGSDYSTIFGRDNTINGSSGNSFIAGQDNVVNAASVSNVNMGNNNITGGDYTVALGHFNTAAGERSLALGSWNTTTGAQSFVIGTGISSSSRLVNPIDTSLAIGFNSTIPTFFVGGGSGANSLGEVGIGTTTPDSLLTVAGAINTERIRITDGVTNGYYLRAQADGTAYWDSIASTADNLGNHIATQNLQIGNFFVSNDGDNEGLSVNPGGEVSFGTTTGTALTISKATESLLMEAHSYGSGDNAGAFLDLYNSRGSSGSIAPIEDGDRLFTIKSRAWYTTSNVADNELLKMTVDGTVGTNKVPTRTDFLAVDTAGVSKTLLTLRSNGNVGIGETEPAYNLDVNGTFSADTLNINDQFTFPSVDGNPNQILQTNGLGTLSWVDVSVDTLSLIQDTDGDTRIELEQNSDEDTIRFTTDGSERFRMGNGRLEVLNTGRSVFLGNLAGAQDNLTNNLNVFIGDSAGYSNTTGEFNTFIGTSTGASANSDQNTAIGEGALNQLTSGFANVAIGDFAMKEGNGNANTIIGSEAFNNSSGQENIAIGTAAMGNTSSTATTGNRNIVIGPSAFFESSGSSNIIIGYQAAYQTNISSQLFHRKRELHRSTDLG